MRILTGRLRGKTIPLTLTQSLRPTQDKVRKAVFDTLQDYTEGKRVLDLYSGTGAMGLEALSRGAAFVHFVEHEKAQANRLERLLDRWGLLAQARVDAMDVLRAIDRASFRGERYDLVLADPPYTENRGADTLSALAQAKVVKPGGFIIVECGKREKMPEEVSSFKMIRDRRYGQARLVIYRA